MGLKSFFTGNTGDEVPIYVDADGHQHIKSGMWNLMGYEEITVGATAVSLNPPFDAKKADIYCAVAPINFRPDGTNPTGSVGVDMNVGDVEDGYDGNLTLFRAIRATASNGKLRVVYFGDE